ncbi:hypothetical protein A5791_15135 [Mycobacterium sp. 852002-51163_SCH5372311]|nr:hypothetical protein A5791_15135 [Mycobacterium sp. 852002-51163_SCH5372311]
MAVLRDLRGASLTPMRLTAAATAHMTAGTIKPACAPPCSARSGITKAPNAIPSGCAVWRIPIANPRCSGGNHPDTNLPPALLQLAAAMPPRNKKTPIISSECTEAAAYAAAAVSAEPKVNTMRSPTWSSTYPQATSVTTMPQVGIDANRPAWASGVPRAASSLGIKKATTLMKRKELEVTTSETIKIDQRVAALVGSLGIQPCLHVIGMAERRLVGKPQTFLVRARCARLRRAGDPHGVRW